MHFLATLSAIGTFDLSKDESRAHTIMRAEFWMASWKMTCILRSEGGLKNSPTKLRRAQINTTVTTQWILHLLPITKFGLHHPVVQAEFLNDMPTSQSDRLQQQLVSQNLLCTTTLASLPLALLALEAARLRLTPTQLRR